MITFHPSENELIEYVTGNLGWAESICIATHLHYCTHCQAEVAKLNNIGGHYLNNSAKASINKNSLEQTLKKIKAKESNGVTCDQDQANTKNSNQAHITIGPDVPPVIDKLLRNTRKKKWSRLSPSLSAYTLNTGQENYEVSLHKIKKGGKVVEHDHKGKEVTIVLEGSFSDEYGAYHPGDYIIKKPGQTHRPTATQDKDCICLSIVEAPIKITGPLGFLMNPFLKVCPQ